MHDARQRENIEEEVDMMILWLRVTNDAYELPEAVAGSAGELARMFGVSKTTVQSAASRYEHGALKSSIWRRVVIEDEVV